MMRRSIVAMLALSPLAALLGVRRRYGRVDYERFWKLKLKRTTLDGVEITHRCRWADDVTGEAECYTTHPPIYRADIDGPETEILRGRVVMT